MFDFEDPWWAVAIALLLCLWIGETVIVVRAVQPLIGASGQYLDYAQETGEPQLPLPLSVMWPLAAVFFGSVLTSLSVYKAYSEYGTGSSRWLWMTAAGGVTLLWALGLVALVSRVGVEMVR